MSTIFREMHFEQPLQSLEKNEAAYGDPLISQQLDVKLDHLSCENQQNINGEIL